MRCALYRNGLMIVARTIVVLSEIKRDDDQVSYSYQNRILLNMVIRICNISERLSTIKSHRSPSNSAECRYC